MNDEVPVARGVGAPEITTPAAPNRFALPWTIYVFLALLIASFVLPPLVTQLVAPKATVKSSNSQADLSDSDFERYVTAETNIRTAFAGEARGKHASGESVYSAALATGLGSKRETLLKSCLDDYVALSKSTHSPNMDRRVLILRHVVGKPLDSAFLERTLRPDLHQDGKTPDAIRAEVDLWRSVYGGKTLAPESAAKDTQLIRAMNLRFLEPQALADLQRAAGDAKAATALEDRLHASALRFMAGELGIIGLYAIAFLVGIGFLICFISAAMSGDWTIVHRKATAPLHLLWGELLDCFVFYLAFYRSVGFFAGLAIKMSGAQLNAHQILLLDASAQIMTGFVAVAYVAAKARRHGVTLAEIGLTVRGSLFREIGYGVAGYLAGMPLIILMGALSRVIFRHSTNTAPNPILPLIVGVHDPVSRTLIFLMASVAAPFFEETFFRGALFTGLRTRFGWQLSALISAMCFALAHPMQDWLPIFALGITFATMREMRQSLVPSMTAHFLQNTLTFVALSSLFSS